MGFEPTDACASAVFKTAAIDHSATLPTSPEPTREQYRSARRCPALQVLRARTSCPGTGAPSSWRTTMAVKDSAASPAAVSAARR